MRKLINSEFIGVKSLLDREKVHCTFAYSVIEGRQSGQIYVDDNIKPTCYLIVCKSGKYLVGGNADNINFKEDIKNYLNNKENHGNYFDLYSSSQQWINNMDDILRNTAAKLKRQVYNWDYSNLPLINKLVETLPEGFQLKTMDEVLFEKYIKEFDSSYKELWGNPLKFLSNGFGFCIVKDNELVSVCNTYYVRDGFAEIDIVTKEEYRKKGLALITSAAFIKHCIENSIEPIWDCDNGNEKSKELANRLGFKSLEVYDMHWWHANRDFVESYLKNYKYN